MALISIAVTAKLICVFVFAYAKSRFSHDAAHMVHSGYNWFIRDIINMYMYGRCRSRELRSGMEE